MENTGELWEKCLIEDYSFVRASTRSCCWTGDWLGFAYFFSGKFLWGVPVRLCHFSRGDRKTGWPPTSRQVPAVSAVSAVSLSSQREIYRKFTRFELGDFEYAGSHLTSLLYGFSSLFAKYCHAACQICQSFAFNDELGCRNCGSCHPFRKSFRSWSNLCRIQCGHCEAEVRDNETSYRRRLLEGLFPVGDEVSKQRPRYEIQLALLWKEDERRWKKCQA